MTRIQVREPDLYSATSRHSWFWDLARSRADADAADRLRRHAEHEAPAVQQRDRQVLDAFRDVAEALGAEVRLNPNSSAGTGGEFTVPLWLVSQFASASRAGRPLGDLCNPLPLPAGVHSISVPRMTTGTIAGVQSTDGEAIAEQDITTSTISSNVVTIGGAVDIAQQLEDQAPAGFDTYAFLDLKRAYNRALEIQLLSGTGGPGQLLGVTNVTGITSITGTGFTSIQTLWPGFGMAAAGVGNNRLLPPSVWLLAPRRWFWIASSVDNSLRPVSSPGNSGPHTTDLVMEGGAMPVGPILGLPVYLDGAIPAGTSPDYAVCCRPDDMLLWETTDKVLVTPEATSGTLQTRIRLYRYVAFLPHRYPTGIGLITNMPQPAGF